MASRVNRRSFLERALVAVGAISGGVIAASTGFVLAESKTPTEVQAADKDTSDDLSDHAAQMSPAAPHQQHSAEDIDRLHEEGLKKFLANQEAPITAGKGGLPLETETIDGVKVFNLTCDEVMWEVEPGKIVAARGYNGA
ncbi:MAG TPA: hypothetical protein VFS30_13560, partial [Dehalococcoidia bacterium]|nr:hypothetical protein [Dehalococcoidia bacterium]